MYIRNTMYFPTHSPVMLIFSTCNAQRAPKRWPNTTLAAKYKLPLHTYIYHTYICTTISPFSYASLGLTLVVWHFRRKTRAYRIAKEYVACQKQSTYIYIYIYTYIYIYIYISKGNW